MTTTTEYTPVADRHGREWVWDPDLHSYCHDDGRAVMLRDLRQIEAQFGLAVDNPAPPRHADSVPVPGVVHGRDDTQVIPAVEQEERAS